MSISGRSGEGADIDAIANYYNGNQLQKTEDNTDNQSLVLAKNDFKDDDNARTEEYLYDKNGNRIADANKGIALIKYNLLNLPEKIYFMNGNKIEYMYDAMGVKHKAKYTTALNSLQIPLGQSMENPLSNVLKKDSVEYFGDYVYTNRVVDKIRTPLGYIQTGGVYNNWDNWKYRYSLTDHQGNTRVTLTSDYVKNHSTTVFTASGQIDYYPFGMEITPPTGTNSGTNPYLYSGKEIDRMHGLNEYDFTARWQDAVVPGFTTMDPLAEQTPWNSPYAYCGGDPVNRIDPTGMEDKPYITISNPDLPDVEIPGDDLRKRGYIHNSDEALAYQYSQDHSNPNNGSPFFSEYAAFNGLLIIGAAPEQSSEDKEIGADLITTVKDLAKAYVKFTDDLDHEKLPIQQKEMPFEPLCDSETEYAKKELKIIVGTELTVMGGIPAYIVGGLSVIESKNGKEALVNGGRMAISNPLVNVGLGIYDMYDMLNK
jgi:RHS repeat-associated protein